MQIEAAPTEKRYEKPEGERRGLIIVNTGDGKGKSTAAFGLALRAHGRGKAVKIYQFMKVPTARFGEHRMFEQIGIPIEGLGDGFSWKSQDLEHSAQLARDGWEKASAIHPVIGLSSFLAQMFLRGPLMEAATQELRIDGTWAEPRVQRVPRQRSAAP